MANSGQRAGDGNEELAGIEHVVSELRADVPVRPAWRDDVLGEVRAVTGRGPRGGAGGARGWTISPPTAIAAALAFTALGASAAVGVLSLRRESTRAAFTDGPAAVSSRPPAPASPTRGPQLTRFALIAPGASRVSLVGDFNQWDAAATPMRPAGDDRLWIVEVPLPPGRHVYAFVVDGDLTPDPAAPRAGDEDFGVPSSVVLVQSRGS